MYKVAVCDDEKSVCHQVEKILLTFAKERCLSLDVEIFYDGSALLEFIETEHNFDLIYMDIEMGNLNGVRTSQEIRHAMDDLHTEIVFISGTENYYRQLFDVQPLLFIGKPICADSITEALLLAMKRNRALTSCFYFKIGKETQRIAFFEILYFESCNRKQES